MITVNSPLEALPFNYIGIGILSAVNNLWTWIAVVTAAVSFWGIRVTGGGDSTPPLKIGHCSAVFEEIGGESERQTAQTDDCEPQAAATPAEKTVTLTEKAFLRPLMCNDGVTKGKLTVYYGGDGELTAISDEGDGFTKGKLTLYCDGDGVGDNDDGEITAISDGRDGEVEEWWERVVRTMNGEDSWYRYVDLTVINGNVVRLWDDNGVRYGGRCSGW
ncbi:PREDICTED: uncharacterized protein LOC104799609 [Tarenaya hassleriana]|uniref:uncharacterized protein LOC104799609 n=1 Tax=Tarenaya hassleriana TaxID=28532 RepID=UPI00053C0DA0|nr:PREDICTED: uncharacterized protein LOC104799609 [Tarenaya hassleriana]